MLVWLCMMWFCGRKEVVYSEEGWSLDSTSAQVSSYD